MGDVPDAKSVLLGRYEPEAAERCHSALALVEADDGFNHALLARLWDEGLSAVLHGGLGHPEPDALEQEGSVGMPLSELHAARPKVARA